ncbi:PASTA domain-containing protein [Pseudarthrobacter sp. H3Y2-7]|uniref:PASTA domain-containing protein n=1 Tax=Pseudarthrobacter naphthalenicus TaxID=3031328 RepID=UPI0023AFA72B|nr:PASTA domain-containing protein [Pseudarthrobacter sp. H3Y2-7]MDE8670788.1 PASTA domain-containing protein [Pseudarthrobacter sp. H3Y2-7]
MGVSNKGDVVKFRMIGVAAACIGLLLAGCGTPTAEPAASPTPTKTVKLTKVPDVAGKPFSEARDLLFKAIIKYEAVGSDGVKFTATPDAVFMVVSSDPAAGSEIEAGGTVALSLEATQAEATAAAAVKEAARVRSLRYSFKCSASENAITAKDNKSFTKLQEIWEAPDFARFKSCDLRVGGKWYMDRYELEPDEAAVVKQIGADGGDASAPYMAYGSVLLLCAIPPKDGWDTKYGEYPSGGPKVRAVAKAAMTMCPEAPFVAELLRVAGGVPPAPKTAMGDGTFVVGRDIAAGSFQVSVPSGANGVHDCYWERTSPQGETSANDFISFAPQGPVVTVYAGEGFVSRGCGNWSMIG